MIKVRHGKIPDWYNEESIHYDTFHEDTDNAKITNKTIEKILAENKVKSVLDLTCGTGSQVFWLAKRGFKVTGADINAPMLKIAKDKAALEKISVNLLQGDVRTLQVGKFDAVITIFNAVGHLTKAGFAKAVRNIRKNLNDGGIYIFDILNLSYVVHNDNIIKLSYEQIRTLDNIKIRELQHSIIDDRGILVSYTTRYEETTILKVEKSIGTLQLYTAKELKEMLKRSGFKTLGQYGIDRTKFSETKTERILTVARCV